MSELLHLVITLTLLVLLVFKQRKINHYEKTYEMEWGQDNSLDSLIKYKQHLQKTSEDLDYDEDDDEDYYPSEMESKARNVSYEIEAEEEMESKAFDNTIQAEIEAARDRDEFFIKNPLPKTE